MFRCEICGRTFKKMRGLNQHLILNGIDRQSYYEYFMLESEDNGFCEECGKPTKFHSIFKGFKRYCGNPCPTNRYIQKKTKRTCVERYGVDHPSKLDFIKEKKKATCRKNFGVDHPFQSEEVKSKSKNASLKKYGVSHPKKAQIVKELCEIKCLSKYGVRNVFQLDWVKEKSRKTIIEKYGVDHPSKSKEVIEKLRLKSLENYGVPWFTKSGIVREQMRQTRISMFLPDLQNYLKEKNLELLDDQYLGSTNKHLWKCLKCGTTFIHDWNSIQQGYLCPKCFPRRMRSKYEVELELFIKGLGLEVETNCRKLIPNRELDIYIPSKKIAIEFDGLFWHDDNHVDLMSHLEKTNLCLENKIRLIHIFEDEWLFRKEDIKTKLKHLLGCNLRRPKDLDLKRHSAESYIFYHFGNKIASIKVLNGFISYHCDESYDYFFILNKFLNFYDSKTLRIILDKRWEPFRPFLENLNFEVELETFPNWFYVDGLRRFKCKEYLDLPKIWDCGFYQLIRR